MCCACCRVGVIRISHTIANDWQQQQDNMLEIQSFVPHATTTNTGVMAVLLQNCWQNLYVRMRTTNSTRRATTCSCAALGGICNACLYICCNRMQLPPHCTCCKHTQYNNNNNSNNNATLGCISFAMLTKYLLSTLHCLHFVFIARLLWCLMCVYVCTCVHMCSCHTLRRTTQTIFNANYVAKRKWKHS